MVKQYTKTIKKIEHNISRVFVGKERQVRFLILGLCSGLHVLIEDVPGVGKTTLARTLADSVGLDFGRIQFTPDLVPGDIVGMTIWSQEKRGFLYREGAIMHQFVLADEINRTSPRTQSSLLEAMQEGSVTVDGQSHPLPELFFVVATQNPENFVGAFPLPEGELDRFGLSFNLGYPNEKEEIEILARFQEENPMDKLEAVSDAAEIMAIRKKIRSIHASAESKRYIVAISSETRSNRFFKLGASPRASQHLLLAAQALALLNERDFVIPEDVMEVANSVLGHRLILSTEARMENLQANDLIQRILRNIPVPNGLNGR